MKKNNIILARKYATAFFDIYSDLINEKFFWKIQSAHLFLEKNLEKDNDILMYFSLPGIPVSVKSQGIDLFLKKLDLPEFKKLMMLLIKQNRVFLFNEILKSLCLIFQKKTNTILFKVTSSFSLQHSDLDILHKFLAYNTGKKIMLKHTIDKNLIAGIKMQSGSLLWEFLYASSYTMQSNRLLGKKGNKKWI